MPNFLLSEHPEHFKFKRGDIVKAANYAGGPKNKKGRILEGIANGAWVYYEIETLKHPPRKFAAREDDCKKVVEVQERSDPSPQWPDPR